MSAFGGKADMVQLTVADMMDYANRNYRNARTAELLPPEYR